MFETLIVSAANRRQGRTVRFFLGTSITYLFVGASVLAVSIIVDTPKMADVGGAVRLVGLPPQLGDTRRPASGGSHQTRPRFDPRNPIPWDRLNQMPTPPRRIAPPDFMPITGSSVDPGGPGNAGGIDGGIGNDAGGDRPAIAQPPQPVPQRTSTPTPHAREERQMVRIPSTVLQGKAIERRTPPYPSIARQIHLQGVVTVEIIISPEGKVESARPVSGPQLLIQAAVDAAWAWRFQPTQLNGVPVRATGVIIFVFKLD